MYDDGLWLEKYNLAKEYYEKNGSLKMPKDYTVNGVKLNSWLKYQKHRYIIGRLSKEKIYLLNKIGIVWKSRNVYSWEFMYYLAKEYYEVNGNVDIPTDYVVKDETGKKVELGVWIARQIDLYNFNKLSLEKVELLEKLGVRFDVKGRYLKYN